MGFAGEDVKRRRGEKKKKKITKVGSDLKKILLVMVAAGCTTQECGGSLEASFKDSRQGGRGQSHFWRLITAPLQLCQQWDQSRRALRQKKGQRQKCIFYVLRNQLSHFQGQVHATNCLREPRQMIRKDSSSGVPTFLKIVSIVPYNQVWGKHCMEMEFLWLWITSTEPSHTPGIMACPRAENLRVCFEVENWHRV